MRNRRTGRILVVDDDRDILVAITEVLEREGYLVATAANGNEALAVLATEPCDLIILDLLMPVMSGWEVIESQVGRDRLRGIPMIVISAAPRDVAPDAATRTILEKPFERGALLRAVAAHLPAAPPVEDRAG
jgi:two-component system, sensor histidine kinase and response regulator